MADKKKVCVIFGGKSPEHDISLKSATSVINNLDKEKYEIIKIGITKNGKWYLYTGDTSKIESGEWEKEAKKRAVISPDAEDKAILVFDGTNTEKIHPDIVFPVLHGEYGEDGTIQGLLELAEIKSVGMGILGSAVGMDKSFSKIAFKDAGNRLIENIQCFGRTPAAEDFDQGISRRLADSRHARVVLH